MAEMLIDEKDGSGSPLREIPSGADGYARLV
jgi:hypothetical protein